MNYAITSRASAPQVSRSSIATPTASAPRRESPQRKRCSAWSQHGSFSASGAGDDATQPVARPALSSRGDAPLLAAVARSGNTKLPPAPVTQHARPVANWSCSASSHLAAAPRPCLASLTTSGIREGTAHARSTPRWTGLGIPRAN